jgi:hypothetical protein
MALAVYTGDDQRFSSQQNPFDTLNRRSRFETARFGHNKQEEGTVLTKRTSS